MKLRIWQKLLRYRLPRGVVVLVYRMWLFLKFWRDLVLNLVSGRGVFVSKQLADRRRRCCQKLDGVCYDSATDRCLICGCRIRFKSRFRAGGCPIRLW